jgi:hypothetical protein
VVGQRAQLLDLFLAQCHKIDGSLSDAAPWCPK